MRSKVRPCGGCSMPAPDSALVVHAGFALLKVRKPHSPWYEPMPLAPAAAEGQVFLGDVHQAVVHRHAAGQRLAQHALTLGASLPKNQYSASPRSCQLTWAMTSSMRSLPAMTGRMGRRSLPASGAAWAARPAPGAAAACGWHRRGPSSCRHSTRAPAWRASSSRPAGGGRWRSVMMLVTSPLAATVKYKLRAGLAQRRR